MSELRRDGKGVRYVRGPAARSVWPASVGAAGGLGGKGGRGFFFVGSQRMYISSPTKHTHTSTGGVGGGKFPPSPSFFSASATPRRRGSESELSDHPPAAASAFALAWPAAAARTTSGRGA